MGRLSVLSGSVWPRVRPSVRVVGVLSAATVLAGGMAVPAAPAAAAQPAAVVPAPAAQVVASRPDGLSAAVSARAQGSRVEIEAERTETSTTWANPDGTRTTEVHGGPIRFRKDDGWANVDLQLGRRPDGSVSPRGHVGGLRLSGESRAAETDAVTVSAGEGRQVVLAWPGSLRAPAVEGTRATYPEVQPGVDMVVEALRTGYEQLFVVKQRPAGPLSWRLPLKTKGLTARAESDGSVSFVDAGGVVVSRFAPAVAWDARYDPASGTSPNIAPVSMTVEQHSPGRAVLVVTPDAGWLADPATVFPVTVDPTYAALPTAYTSFDTFVQGGISSSQSGSTELRLGTYNGSTVARSYLSFPTSAMAGKRIMSATLSLHAIHSYSCNARNWEVWSAALADSSTTWANQPPFYNRYSTTSVTRGYSSSCAAGWVNVDIRSLAQAWADNGRDTAGLGLKAADETDPYGWKKFSSSETSADPHVSVTYDRAPGQPATPTLSPVASYQPPNETAASLYTYDTTPALTSKASDPDGDTIGYDLEVHNSTTVSSTSQKSMCWTGFVASGSAATCSSGTALADNATYYVRARAWDGNLHGPYSGWTTFRLGAATPAAPTISCPSPYSNGSWHDTPPSADVACTVSATGAGWNAPGYVWVGVDGAALTQVKISPSSDPAVAKTTVTVPKTAGGHKIVAQAQTPAGRRSTSASYEFGYGATSMTAPKANPRTTTTSGVRIEAAGPPKATGSATPTAELRWRLAGSGGGEATGWNTSPAELKVTDNGAAGVAVAGTWNTQLAKRDEPAGVDLNDRLSSLLDVQVCLKYSSGTQCTWSQQPVSVLRVPHAFGHGFPVADAGPGQVALWTGEFHTSTTDVSVPGYTGALSLSRSHSTYAGPSDATTGVFGPGWRAQLEGPEAGAAALQVVDSTRRDGTISLVDGDGSALVFTAPGGRRTGADLVTTDTATGRVYTAADEETDLADAQLAVAGSGTGTTMTLTEDDGTKTVFAVTAAPTATTDGRFRPTTVTEVGDPNPTRFFADPANPARVGRILAPVPPGVTGCPTNAVDPLVPGCRALTLEYSTDRLTGVYLELFNPDKAGGAGIDKIKVAEYGYDSTGRLATVRDPRSGLTTSYSYDGDKLATVTPPGQTPIALTYTSESTPRLANVNRARPAGDPAGGTATLASFVYDAVPLTGAGLPDLTDTATGVRAWGQRTAPTRAVAVFGPDHPVTGTSGAGLTAADWAHADLQYTDSLGYTVNTASFGAGSWQLTATDYDERGNVVRELDRSATARARAEQLSAGAVDQLATVTVYDPTGTLVTDSYGPARWAVLGDGSQDYLRAHTRTSYDQGAPAGGHPATGQPFHLPTTVAVTAYTGPAGLGTDRETVTTSTTDYTDDDTGSTAGWQLGTPTESTVTNAAITAPDGSSSTGSITTATRYDSEGRAIETRQPQAVGSAHAGTTRTVYYTADNSARLAACRSKPQWAGLVCVVEPGATPSSGPSLPTSTTTGYTALLAPTTVVETSGAVTRTSTSGYLSDGRPDTSTSTVSGLPSSTPSAGSKTVYHPTSGQPTELRELQPGTLTETGDKTVTGYDSWGRQSSYTTVEGGVSQQTTTSYDPTGRVLTVTDPQGTSTLGYDGTDAAGQTEHRGLPTSVTITTNGAPQVRFTGAYDADGALVLQKLPGGITQTTDYDDAGEPTGLTYTGPITTTHPDGTSTVTDGPWLGWSQSNDVLGRVRRDWTPAGAAFTGAASAGVGDAVGYDRDYSYDGAGRLVQVRDRTALATGTDVTTATADQMPCQTRTYGFDRNGNRTALTRRDANPDGTCATTGGTTTTHGYDTADRLTTGPNGTGSYSYDPLGRALTIPAGDTPLGSAAGDLSLGYYDSDLARSITQNGTTTTYDLDATGRRHTSTTGPTGAAATSTMVRHYTDSTDNPGWTQDTTTGSITRYAESLGGDLAANITPGGTITLPLATLHGDVVTTITLPTTGNATGIDSWADYDEYGNPRDRTATDTVDGPAGYGWLGAKQRATTDSGLLLMGVRLYNPVTGQFTSLDPVPGGGSTAYAYPTDPVNVRDLDGKVWSLLVRGAIWGCKRVCARAGRAAWTGAKWAAGRAWAGAKWGAGRTWAGAKWVGYRTPYGIPRWYKNSKGGGIDFYRKGQRFFSLHWHRFTVKGKTMNRPHYHRLPGIGRHRPWQPHGETGRRW